MFVKRELDDKIRQIVYERDGNRCVICGRPPTTCHHAYFGADLYQIDNKLRNTIFNLVSICSKCHRQIHTYENKSYERKCRTYLQIIKKLNDKINPDNKIYDQD